MQWLDYREKLRIGFNDDQKGCMCVALIQNKLDDLVANRKRAVADLDVFGGLFDPEGVSQEEYDEFCRTTGTRYGGGFSLPDDNIYRTLDKHQNSFRDFLTYYVAFINCLTNRPQGIKQQDLLNILDESFLESGLKYAILMDEGKYFVFPKGAKELDDALVSEPLEWLSNYPSTKKTFVIALKQYQDGIYIRDAADNLRKALEVFLQEFLSNEKNLENNKGEIIRYLNERGVDTGVSGLFLPLINTYKNINDRTAKHNDKVDKRLMEFLLYQTGLLIRMVLVVHQSVAEATTNAD